MSDVTAMAATWLLRTLLAGGALLLLAAVFMAALAQPVRRRMIGAVAVRAALIVPVLALGPQWLRLSLPADAPPQPVTEAVADIRSFRVKATSASDRPAIEEPPMIVEFPVVDFEPATRPVEAAVTRPREVPAEIVAPMSEPVASETSWLRIVVLAYLAVAAIFLARWLIGLFALRRLIRKSRPASASLVRLLQRSVAGATPELRIAPGLAAPVCGGILRPVVLLPQRLAESGDEETLRWVFAHEMAHLRHGDARTACWFGLAAALFWALPWFWWLRRRVELCQEFVADAEAAARSRPEEYAAFLVDLSRSARPTRRVAGVSGVLGKPSELYRRIAMLLNPSKRVDRACPRRWSLLASGAFLCAAVVLSGFGLTRDLAASPEDPKAEKVEPPKKDVPKADVPKRDADEKFVRPKAKAPQLPFDPDGQLDPEQFDLYLRKMMDDLQKRLQGAGLNGGFIAPRMMNPNNPFMGFNRSPGRLGASVETPHAALVEHLDLPKDQGIVLIDIQADSAAEKAGLKANDILLEINGKPVTSDVQQFRSQIAEIKADEAVDAVILRKGKRETIKGVKLPEARENEGFGGFQGLPQGPGPAVIDMPVPRALPNQPFAGAFRGAQNQKGMQLQMTNGNFTVTSRDNDMSVTLTGKADEGKTTVTQITINDGGDSIRVDNLEAVPEKYRAKVDGLLKSIPVKGAK